MSEPGPAPSISGCVSATVLAAGGEAEGPCGIQVRFHAAMVNRVDLYPMGLPVAPEIENVARV